MGHFWNFISKWYTVVLSTGMAYPNGALEPIAWPLDTGPQAK